MSSLSKIHSILELLRENNKIGLSNKEISIVLKIPQSTCYRILSSLKELGYIQHKPNDMNYILGFTHLRFAQALFEGLDENAIIDPFLEDIHKMTERTAVFSRFNGHQCIAMGVRGSVNTRISVGLGEIMPLHCSAAGKVVLAFAPENEGEKLLAILEMAKLTPATIYNREVLRNELEQIRKSGAAYNNGEFHQGINSMATPLFDRNNRVFGALAMVGTSQDLPMRRLRNYVKMFHTNSRVISEALGGRYPGWFEESDETKYKVKQNIKED